MSEIRTILQSAFARGQRALSEYEAKRVLKSAGIPVTREYLVDSVEAALAAADSLGFPVVLKGCGPTLLHKTELDMIRLGIGDASALERAYADIAPRLPPGAAVLVQESVSGRRELIAGVTRDRIFGPCVSLGVGGIFAEILQDVSFRVAPFDRAVAASMSDDLAMGKVFGAVRGMPPVDRERLTGILVALGRLAIDYPEIAEIDINPLIVAGDKPVAVDALVALASLGPHSQTG